MPSRRRYGGANTVRASWKRSSRAPPRRRHRGSPPLAFSTSSASVGSPSATSVKGLNMTRLPGRQAWTFYLNGVTPSLLDTEALVPVTTPDGIQGASRECRLASRSQPATQTPSVGDADGMRGWPGRASPRSSPEIGYTPLNCFMETSLSTGQATASGPGAEGQQVGENRKGVARRGARRRGGPDAMGNSTRLPSAVPPKTCDRPSSRRVCRAGAAPTPKSCLVNANPAGGR